MEFDENISHLFVVHSDMTNHEKDRHMRLVIIWSFTISLIAVHNLFKVLLADYTVFSASLFDRIVWQIEENYYIVGAGFILRDDKAAVDVCVFDGNEAVFKRSFSLELLHLFKLTLTNG
jgi:hypothetical protein